MMYELLSKALFRIEDFKARLAAVEAERDAARAEVERLKGELEVEENNYPYPDFSCGTFAAQRGIELRPAGGPTYTTTIEHWQGLLGELKTVQGGEARAVELCVKASKVIRWCLESITRIDPIGGMEGFPDEFGGVGYDCEVIGESSSALDWLDQQRREAVAAWIEKEATKCRKQNNEYYDRGVDCMLREAAALRAGEVPND